MFTNVVYPHLVDFTGKLNFRIKVDSLNLESQNQAKNISVVHPSSPIKIWDKSVTRGYWVMIGQTNRQTNKDYNYTYIYDTGQKI